MANPVRHFEPQKIYFLTSRTVFSRFLMAPSKQTNELIGGILARAVRNSGVELFAYVFTSNHFHLIARAPSSIAMSNFMQGLQSQIAIKVGRFIKKLPGPFFAHRYSSAPIVDEGAQVERLQYILAHGVKEGLVSEVKKWPGLSSTRALLDGGTATLHRWRNWTQRWKMKACGKVIDRFSEDCPSDAESLALAPLPCWAGHTAQQRAQHVAQLIAGIDATAPNKIGRDPARIAAQDPYGGPRKTKLTPRPMVHASIPALGLEAIQRYRGFLESYRHAARQWLAGAFDVEFPLHCFRPPPWRVPVRLV